MGQKDIVQRFLNMNQARNNDLTDAMTMTDKRCERKTQEGNSAPPGIYQINYHIQENGYEIPSSRFFIGTKDELQLYYKLKKIAENTISYYAERWSCKFSDEVLRYKHNNEYDYYASIDRSKINTPSSDKESNAYIFDASLGGSNKVGVSDDMNVLYASQNHTIREIPKFEDEESSIFFTVSRIETKKEIFPPVRPPLSELEINKDESSYLRKDGDDLHPLRCPKGSQNSVSHAELFYRRLWDLGYKSDLKITKSIANHLDMDRNCTDNDLIYAADAITDGGLQKRDTISPKATIGDYFGLSSSKYHTQNFVTERTLSTYMSGVKNSENESDELSHEDKNGDWDINWESEDDIPTINDNPNNNIYTINDTDNEKDDQYTVEKPDDNWYSSYWEYYY